MNTTVDLTRAGTRCPRCGAPAAVPGRPGQPAWDDGARGARPLLAITLEVAVPMWLDVLAAMSPAERDRHIVWWTQTAIEPVCFKGDTLQYGGGKKGEVAEGFNYLASALAALAYAPGGVTFAGRHWCTLDGRDA